MGCTVTRPLVLLLAITLAGGCTAADGDDSGGGDDGVGSDAGADEEGYGEYDGENGTGAGADDGDGPEDDIPNEEDETDSDPGPDEELTEPGEALDIADESGVPDEDDPYLEPDTAVAALALVPPQLNPGCTAKATLGGATAWFFFVRPDDPCTGDAGSGKDRHALRELVRLIESVPEGGRIDAHIFSIAVDRVAEALYNAQSNGVTVYLSTDGQIGKSKDVSKTVYLDQLENKVYCSGSNRACISTAESAISHTKLFTFSHATAPDGTEYDDVVWFGSANQSYHSGMNLFNNTVTIYGATGLYKDLRHYLEDLYNRKRAGDYYKPTSGRGRILRNPANVYVSPEAETDLVTHRLDDLSPADGCVVRAMQAVFRDSRLAVVNRLVKMKSGKCDVKVVAHNVEPEALKRFKAAGIPVHGAPVHDKSFLIHGRFGSSWKYRVFTGSHNMSYGADHKFDEIFVKLAPESDTSHPVYDAYMQHFADAYEDGDPL
jgi:hypothetical protein